MNCNISKITSLVVILLFLQGCGTHPTRPKDIIVGQWLYLRAERLGDYSQNDSSSISEFDRGKQGAQLVFNKDGTFTTEGPDESRVLPFRQGMYTISQNGDSLAFRKDEELKILLTDTTLKITTPNNAIIIWKKVTR